MRRIYTIIFVAFLVAFTSCQKRVVIPDNTLVDIFHDAFVVNAYVGYERMNLDSIAMYESIFNHYGYTAQDVAYTVGNFSRRKSARLGTIVEKAISRLESESKLYEKRVVILDTIRDVAIRSFTRTIFEDTLISAKRRADSKKLRIAMPIQNLGEYIISYEYECKDNLEKYPRRAEMYFTDERGRRSSNISLTLHKKEKIRRTMTTRNEKDMCCSLIVELGNYMEINSKKRQPKKQDLTIRNLNITYKPHENVAVDSLYERFLPIKIFANGFLIKKDSISLPVDTTRVVTAPTNNN